MEKIPFADNSCKYRIMSSVLNLIEKDMQPPVFMCIGSPGVSGDILGPAVGELLTHRYNVKAFVYGTLKRPLTSANVTSVHNFIRSNHTFSKIFAIDASLGKEEDNGIISVYKGGIVPGAALSKGLPQIGDYSITANVNMFGTKNIVSLLSARLEFVYCLAQNIAFGINDALSIAKACRAEFAAV